MNLEPIAIATRGYVCSGAPDDIAIATQGYACVVQAVTLPPVPRPPVSGGGSTVAYDLMRDDEFAEQLEREDDEMLRMIVAVLEAIWNDRWQR